MDSFITGGEAISSSAYANDHDSLGSIKDKPIELLPVLCTQNAKSGDIKKLSNCKLTFNISLIAAIISGIAFFILLFHNIPLAVGSFMICAIGIIITITSKTRATRYFKDEIVLKTIRGRYPDACYNRTNHSVSPHLFESFRNEDIDPDLISGAELRHLVKYLDLGGKAWNQGVVSDEVIATCQNTRFRFFDTFLELVTYNGNSTSRTPIFRGQIYIFPAKIQFSCDKLFLPTNVSKTSSMLSSYFDIINVFNYSPEIAPYYKTSGLETIARAFSKLTGNDSLVENCPCPHDKTIETPEFMECMLKLYQLLPGINWSVRLVNGFFILVIMREKDIFEFSFSGNAESAFANLGTDLTEMFTITDIIAEYAK